MHECVYTFIVMHRHVGFKSKSPSESESEEARQHLKRLKIGEIVPVVPMEIQDGPVRLISPSKSVKRKNEEKKQQHEMLSGLWGKNATQML